MTKKTTTLFHTDLFRSINGLTRKETTTMRMKSALTHALVLSLAMLGALAAAPTAYAGVKANHPGNICKNYNAGEVSKIDYLTNATRSLATFPTQVICPLTRNTGNSNGAGVFVDVWHSGTQTTSCTAYSSRADGTPIVSRSKSWGQAGYTRLFFDLTGANKSDLRSNYSVLCAIPGNANGLIYSVNLDEQ